MSSFSFSTDEPQDAFVDQYAPMQDGKYMLIINDAAVKENSKRTGLVAVLQLAVANGPAAGKKIRASFNVEHQDPSVRGRGRRDFRDLCLACGINTVTDQTIGLLKNKVLIGDVVQDSYTDYRKNPPATVPSNKVAMWYKLDDAQAAAVEVITRAAQTTIPTPYAAGGVDAGGEDGIPF